LQSLKSGHDAELFALGTDQPDWADADLFILTWAVFLYCLTIKKSNIPSP
jgi:hypothetical protein